jgi:hypothetical protein
MAKYNFQPNARVHAIFDDLEKYRDFCVEYGYRFNEAELYSTKSYVFRQYTKLLQGKPIKNMWDADMKAA